MSKFEEVIQDVEKKFAVDMCHVPVQDELCQEEDELEDNKRAWANS